MRARGLSFEFWARGEFLINYLNVNLILNNKGFLRILDLQLLNMLTKKNIEKQLEEMPDQFSMDEFIDRLILIDKIEEGIEDSNNGREISHEEMKNEIETWFK